MQAHPRVTGRFQEAVDDRLRAISDGKHPPVILGFQRHPAVLKPPDHIQRLPSMKCLPQLPRATRVVFHQLRRIKTIVRDVAAAATGDPDLAQEVRAALVDRHLGGGGGLRSGDRREKAGRTSADHRDFNGCGG